MNAKTNQSEIETLPNGLAFAMIKVKGGRFKMGDDASEYSDEKPAHFVRVPDFYISPYLVTNSQFAVFLNDYAAEKVKEGEHLGEAIIYEHRWGVRKESGQWRPAKGFEQHPVINVSWYGALAYCDWLSEQTGKAYRLPSEAEWEYAARGGLKSSGFPYAGGRKLKEVGWYDLNSHGETKPVGLKLPNELGLYDMSGNVWEWCADYWHDNYEGAPADGSAWVTGGNADRRAVRGGSWDFNDADCRVSYRDRLNPDLRFNDIGFRLARY